MAATPPLTQLGRYVIVRTLGHGAMGVVYEAHDPKLERTVAIKTILKGHLLDSTMAADYSARFVREAQAVARLTHPNIVTVFDFGEQDEVAYLVMEFIRGRELAASFDAGDHLDLRRGLRVMTELLDALAYAHERGIVHRDVKPANVMIDETGHVKLTDFGVARLVDSNSERTMAGTMVGTPSYMSPEQIQGLAVGSRADLFAAGVILYQFLTGRKPFTGGGAFSIQKAIVHDDPVPPTQLNPALPPQFDAIIARVLAKDPAERHASASALADELRLALRDLPGGDVATQTPPTDDPDATIVRSAKPGGRTATQPFARTAAGTEAARHAPATPGTTLAPAPAEVASTTVSAAGTSPAAVASGPVGASRSVLVGSVIGAVAIAGALAFVLSRPPVTPADPKAADGAASAAPAPAAAPAATPVAATTPPSAGASAGLAPPVAPAAPVAGSAPLATGAAASPRDSANVAAEPAPRPARDEPRKPAAEGAAQPSGAGARAAAIRASASRCSDFLQRLQLGDTLSGPDLEVFQKECKR